MRNFAVGLMICCIGALGHAATWLPADGDGRDALDGNDVALLNGAMFDEGVIGQAFDFDGVDDLVVMPRSSNLDPQGQLTIAFWMRADAENSMFECCQGLVTSDNYLVEISNGNGGVVGVNFAINTGSGFVHTSDANGGGLPVTPGEWHHVAATYDGSKIQLYVDGERAGDPVRVSGRIAPMNRTSFLSIGSEDGRTSCEICIGTRYFHGQIDEVYLHPRAYSAAQIRRMASVSP